MDRRVTVFMNESSGTCRGRRPAIEAAFLRHNLPCKIIPVDRNLTRLVREAEGSIVVAAGGDGTISSIAAALTATQTCLGILPLGTLNHFAKDLGIPLDLDAAVQTIAEGQPIPVDAGEVNGRLFINNSSLGFYPGMVLHRERLKKVGLNKWLSLLLASIRSLIRFHHISVCITTPTQTFNVTTPFVFIGNNEYTMEGSGAGSRQHLDQGRLYLYLAPGATRLSLLALTIAALRHKVSEAAHFESFCVEQCTVDLRRRRPFRISLDGEIHSLKSPLRYLIRPAALRVITPKPSKQSSVEPG